ncbi:MAG TPA: patatin-like phospholipase family protein [Actinophytocola sp.]|uniref:patatin-like phospholipase family protein n=1 Tax=Actinophytocola sp. TaxID=1872138 RepID=UPI002DBA5164|nr:patatin-like phospholipase family protein [Actinophytocola sp.]HEU5470784.1 patatin-like phospholipase family protein [Actinophytocola sp.]
MAGRALVLGGGGLAGIAWETGMLAGMAAEGHDVTGAEVLIGTSAGSVVASQVATAVPLATLFDRQADPARWTPELPPNGIPLPELFEMTARWAEEIDDPAELRRRVGTMALATETVAEPDRRAVIAARLPVHDWPGRPLSIVAVDVHTGDPRVFDRDSGVPLIDAVAASCAVPGVWPPVTIGETRYIDGGLRSLANADLASGSEVVLVLAAIPDPALDDQVAELSATGSRVTVLTPDEESLAAFGTDPLDPATRTPAAKAGHAQGRRAAATIATLWT